MYFSLLISYRYSFYFVQKFAFSAPNKRKRRCTARLTIQFYSVSFKNCHIYRSFLDPWNLYKHIFTFRFHCCNKNSILFLIIWTIIIMYTYGFFFKRKSYVRPSTTLTLTLYRFCFQQRICTSHDLPNKPLQILKLPRRCCRS